MHADEVSYPLAVVKVGIGEREVIMNSVTAHTAHHIAAPIGASQRERNSVKLLTEIDNIETNLTTFERMMEAYETEEAQWPYKLALQYTGKAQQAYASLSPDEAKSVVKATIFCRLQH